MYYAHNAQIEEYGRCRCECHQGSSECTCGWLTIFPRGYTRIVLRPGRLTSRVRAFGARGARIESAIASALAKRIHPLAPKKKEEDDKSK